MRALLRSVWNEPRPSGAPVRVWRDWALIVVLLPLALIEGAVRRDLPGGPLAVVITVALLPTLLWRRTRPLLVVLIAFAVPGLAQLLAGGRPMETGTMAFLLLLPYALFRWGSGREAVVGLAVMLARLAMTAVFPPARTSDVIGGLTVLGAACALGAALRYRAGAMSREFEQVRLLERERLARDLHDTVAHHVSAIAIRAQAGLATAPSDPAAATDALRVIEAEASRTLAEMRGMVRILRRSRPGEPGELAPTPGIVDLERLAGTDGGGPRVDVELVGDLDGLSPSVGAAVYRLAQESVTNARRHARHATRIEVSVAADDTSVHLRVSDNGDPTAIRTAGSPGYGLIGMIERADLMGGSCRAGPNPDRGWTVSAVLPRTGPVGATA